jgi:uncharacterized metal-binding protein
MRKPRCHACKHFDCAGGKDCFKIGEETRALYREDQAIQKAARAAARVEARFYGAATRLEEIALFALEMKMHHLGLVFCTGFKEEAHIVADMLSTKFKVSSVCCKCGAVPKKALRLPRVRPEEEESMCNPVGQALLMNRAEVELNILLGLCVGHDALFNRHAKALVTTFVAKDRVLAHNPVGAVYSPYLKRRLHEGLFAPNP